MTIEFRWVDREIKRDPKISHYHGPDRETVLQFRTEEYWVSYGVGERVSPYPLPGWNIRWTEWQEIPTVRE